MKNVFLTLLVIFFFASCTNEKDKLVGEKIVKIEKEIKSSPSDKLFEDLNVEYQELFKDKRLASDKKEQILERAYNFFKDSDKFSYAASYLTRLLKDFPGDKSQGRIKELISVFDAKGSTDMSKLIKMLYSKKYTDDKNSLEAYSKDIAGMETNFDTILLNTGKIIFGELEKTGKLNVKAAKDYVNQCEAYAIVKPQDSRSPEYLFKAAEVAHTIKSLNKTFELYDWILEKYPNYSKTPTALFLKGYIFDNELKKYDEATKLYDEFLEKYPNSDLVDDVMTMKKYMGKTDEEILKEIEKNKK